MGGAGSFRFQALSYHYIRPPKDTDPFPRILGTPEEEFRAHLKVLKKIRTPLSLDDVRRCYYASGGSSSADGVLVTFDDGLSDHHRAARILAEEGFRGTFFIPSCVLEEGTPANPQIVHYSLARRGIDGFLAAYRVALEEERQDAGALDVSYDRASDDPWETIRRIKQTLHYKMHYRVSRKVLLRVWTRLFADMADALSAVHLTRGQIREMLGWGHSIGTHSRTHFSIGSAEFSSEDLHQELIEPRRFMEEEFGVPVRSMSYPFGMKRDCLSAAELVERTREYELAFTIEPVANGPRTNPLELGRYMPTSKDSADDVRENLERMAAGVAR